MCGCLSHAPPRDPTRNLGMCPDWESNQQPLNSQASTQSTELYQLWCLCDFLNKHSFISWVLGLNSSLSQNQELRLLNRGY